MKKTSYFFLSQMGTMDKEEEGVQQQQQQQQPSCDGEEESVGDEEEEHAGATVNEQRLENFIKVCITIISVMNLFLRI